MKSSQHYPPAFGRALNRLFEDNMHEIQERARGISCIARNVSLDIGGIFDAAHEALVGSGWVWLDLVESGWIWLALVGSG